MDTRGNFDDSVVLAKKHLENLRSPNPRQRSQAAEELGKLKYTPAVTTLITMMQEDVNTYVRTACAEALGHIGDGDAVFPLMDALHDSCSFVRRAAAIALGQMQAKQAQAALLQALGDSNFYVRRAAINAIGKLEIADMGPLLLPLLETSDPRIRRTVITALRRLNTRMAVPQMIAILKSYVDAPTQRELPIVKTLVHALGELRTPEAAPVLIDVVRGYVGVRSMAALALGHIGDPQAGPVLQEALQDKSTNLRLAALKSLGRLRYQPAAAEVRKFLAAPDPRIRRMAALTLGYIGNKEAIPALLQMAQEDPSSLVRPAAIDALGTLGDASVVSDLLPLVNDTNAYLRAALSQTLSRLNPTHPEVKLALARLAQDQVEHVAIAAGRVIQTLEPEALATPPDAPRSNEIAVWFKKLLGRS